MGGRAMVICCCCAVGDNWKHVLNVISGVDWIQLVGFAGGHHHGWYCLAMFCWMVVEHNLVTCLVIGRDAGCWSLLLCSLVGFGSEVFFGDCGTNLLFVGEYVRVVIWGHLGVECWSCIGWMCGLGAWVLDID